MFIQDGQSSIEEHKHQEETKIGCDQLESPRNVKDEYALKAKPLESKIFLKSLSDGKKLRGEPSDSSSFANA